MFHYIFVPFELFRLLASLQLTNQVRSRRSFHGVSLDLTLYSWVWALTHTIANSLYCFSSTVYTQYATRYPLYSDLPSSKILTAFVFAQLCINTVLSRKCFFEYESQERLSILCKTVLSSLLSMFFWFCWLYFRGKETINLLDLADCLHNIGSIALACHLVPQISLNWFLDTSALQKSFLLLNFIALTCASIALYISYKSGLLWFELPISSPSQFVLGVNWCALVSLTYQHKLYGTQKIFSSSQKAESSHIV